MSDKTIQNTTVGTVQPGALTAIARKEDFLQHLQDFLDTHKTEKWCVAAIDVEHFRLYNELYGTEQGDTLLNTLASHLLDYQRTSGCPVGYWGNDDFFLCLPDDRVQQQDIVITLQTCVSPNHQDVTFFLALGLCPVSEHPEADAATLCNYAQIAVMNPDHSGSGIHRLPRPVCGAGIPRRLQQRAGLQLCAQQGAERRDRGGALHQNRRCTLHPQDHPVFLQRLSHPRDHLDLCR